MKNSVAGCAWSCVAAALLMTGPLPRNVNAQASVAVANSLKVVPENDRVHAINNSGLTPLHGHLPVWIGRQSLSVVPIDLSEAAELTLVLRRSDEAEKAFQLQLQLQQTPGSPLYHRAVSPEDVGRLYGPTQHDLDALETWLQSAGLTVVAVSPSRTQVVVRGSLAMIEAAFRVHFSMYNTADGPQRGPDTEPQVPDAFEAIVSAVAGLTMEHPHPEFTGSRGGHFVTPADFATIYNVTPVYTAGNTGAMVGSQQQRVAIAATSAADANQVQAFLAGIGRSGASYTEKLVTGRKIGYTGSEGEAELDIERVIGTAPGVGVDLVEAPTVYAAAYYAVNNTSDEIVNVSFGECEQNMGQAMAKRWQDLWSTAASKMVSVFVSAGDSGAAACGAHGGAPPATQMRAVSGICTSAYNTCVGGTEFNDSANPTQYWSTTNDQSSKRSALGYIPEGAWNEATETDANGNVTYRLQAGGGGASSLVPKPSWQTGSGVPADGFRDIPDISFTAAAHDGYYTCYAGVCDPGLQSNPATFVAHGYYGTSASSPSMAGIAALLNSAAGAPQGLLNPMIYKLAGSSVAAQIFHDVTVASSGVANCDASIPSMCNNSTPGTNSLSGGQDGYAVGDGYDLATGWGSLNVANFIRAAVLVNTTLSLNVNGSTIGLGQPISALANLVTNGTSLASPSGTVQFFVNGSASGSAVALDAGGVSTELQFTASGIYTVTATYSGDALYAPSTSTSVVVVVSAQPPSLSVVPGTTSLVFASGVSAGNTTSITVSGGNNFTGLVSLTCVISATSAAFQPTCQLYPAIVSLGVNGTATAALVISFSTPQATLTHPYLPGSGTASRPLLALTGMFLLSLSLSRKRSLRLLMFVTATGITGMLLIGCSGDWKVSSPLRSGAGSYVITVTASGMSSGALASSSASTTVDVVIQ